MLSCLGLLCHILRIPRQFQQNLPTVDEIESSQDVLCDHSVRKVEGVGQNFIASDGGQDVFSFDSERAFTTHSSSCQ